MTATWGCPSTEANAVSRRDAYFIEVTRLRRQNDELRERVRNLEARLEPRITIKAPTHLTSKERQLLEVLMQASSKAVVTKEQIYSALYYLGGDDVSMKIVDIWVCKVRAKLRPFGVTIETAWGRGFWGLSDESRKIVAGW